MMGYNSMLDPFEPPPANRMRTVQSKSGPELLVFNIRTYKLLRSPNYLYSAYLQGNDQEPLLQWISNPGDDDLLEALHQFNLNKAKEKR